MTRSSRWTLAPLALIGFGLAALLVLAGGLAALHEHRESRNAGDWARHALNIMLQIGRVHEGITDAESGERGYLLTGDESYMEPYQRARADVSADVPRLRELIRGDERQEARMASLEPLVASRLDELRRTIDARRERGAEAALALVRANAANATMSRIQASLNEIEAAEARRLAERLQDRMERSRLTDALIGFTTAAAVLLMLLSLVLLARSARARMHAEARARASDEVLRRELSLSLASSELRAQAVLDTVVTPIISIDEEGRIDTFNRAAERTFGYTAAEAIGRNVALLMPSPYDEEHDGYLRSYLETNVAKVIGLGREVTGRRKDGTTFPLHIAVTDTPLDGRHHFTGILRDLTQEKEAEKRERQLQKQAQQHERLADIGAMTARIAHDFGNPLAGLIMTAERILHRIARDPTAAVESVKPAAAMLIATAKRLDGLVGEFKEFAREQRLDLRDIDLPAFLAELASAWEPEATARGISLQTNVGEAPPTIRGDPNKLRRVLDNLVKNALEAVERGPGLVRVAATTRGPGKVRIVVEDSGPGIPEGTDVFALFETTKASGTGLGLPICMQIVAAHGGDIRHASRPSGGTVFSVELPVAR